MLKQFTQEIKHGHNRFARLLFIIVVASAVVLILPGEAQFKYEFEQGKPWLHEDLIAPFDFAVLKTDKQKEVEKKRIKEKTKLYFVENPDIQKEAVERFETGISFEFDEKPADSVEAFSTFGSDRLRALFETGIVESTSAAEGEEVINVVRKRFEERKPLNSLYTSRSATREIESMFSSNPPQDSLTLQNLIIENIRPNLLYDPQLSDKIYRERVDRISDYYGKVSKNEKIISRGEIVDADTYQKLNAFKKAYINRYENTQTTGMLIAGRFIIVFAALFVLLFYLTIYKPDIVNEFNKFSLVLILFLLWVYMGALSLKFEEIDIYLLPFCILPIVVRNFFDARPASFLYTITIMITGLIAPNAFEFIFIQLMTGLIALFTLSGMRKRSQFIMSAFVIFITYSILYYAFSVIKEGTFESIDHGKLVWFAGSALLTLLSYPLIFVFEKTFKLISDVTLLELSDTNNEVLRRLNLKAPGTFQHSMQVANLAEEASTAVDADSLLIRTGALYHDIGKMDRPAYFIENQTGTGNPHDDLDYKESADIIIGHVIAGIEKAREFGLPEQIIDFIRTHHGTTCTRYFYHCAKKEDPDCSIEDYRYPGPIPFNKETAILMMADSVEAASRSLKDHEVRRLEKLVDEIIDGQLNDDQFINADITLRDISVIKKIFKRRLKSIYHVRVEYPDD